MTDQVRAFLAIKIESEELIDRVLAIQHRLDTESAKMKLVESENIHFTLRFLGDTSISKLNSIQEQLQELRFDEFQIDIGGIGAFQSIKRPRVIWIGVKQNGELITALKQQIDMLMTPLGYPPERKKFAPHATIARVRHVRNASAIEANLQFLADEHVGSMQVSSVKMMKSQLTPSGPIYTQLWQIRSS